MPTETDRLEFIARNCPSLAVTHRTEGPFYEVAYENESFEWVSSSSYSFREAIDAAMKREEK